MPTRALALTTINGPDNACLQLLSAGAQQRGIPFYVAGDTKTPAPFSLPGCTYLSIADQEARFPALGKLLPTKHYARKNIAYLAAIEGRADEIQETDDDNFPRDAFWSSSGLNALTVETAHHAPGAKLPWINVYELFSKRRIWPRGLPLEAVHHSSPVVGASRELARPLILQGLADENPDVDAVYRMTCDLPVDFDKRPAVMAAPGSWCPFNSQNTIFQREAFALLYLPSYCSFRMTDIWRSFVAQRCLWELGQGVVFHESTVYQTRNEHNLLRDFEDEVPGYLLNEKIRIALEACTLDRRDIHRNVIVCYEAMVEKKFVPADELPLVRAWLQSLESLAR